MKFAIACKSDGFWHILDEVRGTDAYIRIQSPADLDVGRLESHGIETVFFAHWSWIVPEDILSRFECVCFHSAPVPFGRGGSPIQNMIALGREETEIVALRMQRTLDSGPVYMRERCSLLGGGEEVMIRIYRRIGDMIAVMCQAMPEAVPQEGPVTIFRRRTPEESRIPQDSTLPALFDHIRMLDIEGYPSAFLDHGRYRLRFSRPALRFGGRIEATVSIELANEERPEK